MKHLGALAMVVVWLAPLVQAGGTLKEARAALLRGNYAESREAYEALLKNAKTRAAAAIGLSKACQEQGEYDQVEPNAELAVVEEVEVNREQDYRQQQKDFVPPETASAQPVAEINDERRQQNDLGCNRDLEKRRNKIISLEALELMELSQEVDPPISKTGRLPERDEV